MKMKIWNKTLMGLAFIMLVTASASAFPTWMGVYGDFTRREGSNPGTFTILMNQSYYGLNAQVGITVNGESWDMHDMTYSGDVDGNSIWTFTPDAPFPGGSTVDYFFYGYDGNGGQIWDSNNAQNYSFSIPPDGPLAFGPAVQIPHSEDIFYLEDVDMAAYKGTVYAVWSEAGGVPGVRFAKKPLGGNWSTPVTLVESGWKCAIAVAESGIHVTYAENGDMVYRGSQDGGQTWNYRVADFMVVEQKMDADENGAYVAYTDSIDSDVYVRTIPADNPEWGTPMFVFQGVMGYWSTQINDFHADNGNMVLCSYDSFYRMGGHRYHAYRESTDGGSTWTEITPSGATFLQVGIDSNNTVHLLYNDGVGPEGDGAYYCSRSFGGIWTDPVKLIGASVAGLSVLNDQIIAVTSDGITAYKTSTDGGATWSGTFTIPGVDYVTKDLADGDFLHLFSGSMVMSATSSQYNPDLEWFGDTWHWPFDGQIRAADDLWINTYTYPKSAAASARLVYGSDNGSTWNSVDLELEGADGQKDWWHVNLGHFVEGTTIQYAIEVVDQEGGSYWHKDFENGGQDYFARVNRGAYTYWAGHTIMFSPSGAPIAAEEIWISTEAWPKGGAVAGKVWYTADGGISWHNAAMMLVGEIGNNDRFHFDLSLLGYPAGTTIQYAIQIIDGFGNSTWDSNGGSDYYITLE